MPVAQKINRTHPQHLLAPPIRSNPNLHHTYPLLCRLWKTLPIWRKLLRWDHLSFCNTTKQPTLLQVMTLFSLCHSLNQQSWLIHGQMKLSCKMCLTTAQQLDISLRTHYQSEYNDITISRCKMPIQENRHEKVLVTWNYHNVLQPREGRAFRCLSLISTQPFKEHWRTRGATVHRF